MTTQVYSDDHNWEILQPHTFSNSSSQVHLNCGFKTILYVPNSPPPSIHSSPRILHVDSIAPSLNSISASSISFDTPYNNNDDDDDDDDQVHIVFPLYDNVGYYGRIEDLKPLASPRRDPFVSPTPNNTSTTVSRSSSSECIPHAEDDAAVFTQPSRHVDYLSHNWIEEDIWSSWKHIASKRGVYHNRVRLENALWRAWTKSKNNLMTVLPETLDWLKDCDVTWLYGPLQTSSHSLLRLPDSSPSGNSVLHYKKPILKKRGISEIMLGRSLSAFSLKQDAAAIQAQQFDKRSTDRSLIIRSASGVASPFTSRRTSRENISALPSVSSSSLASPETGQRKHIKFNELVAQFIALDVKDNNGEQAHSDAIHDDDDRAKEMKRSYSNLKSPEISSKKTEAQASFSAESKTITMLPSTRLKHWGDIPESPNTAMKHRTGFWNWRKLSVSPSQEILRPSKSSTRILLGDNNEDDDEDDDADVDWQPPSAFVSRKDSFSGTQDRWPGLNIPGNSASLNREPSGARRTPSGMFTPCEGDEDDVISEGLFGKFVDTVNTAKDITHVIWNVGWR